MIVSVVIPTYNNSSLLALSLETWAAQSLPIDSYEVIIVDNNSSDDTPEVTRAFTAKYPYFHYVKECKIGATQARHAGARQAQTNYLVFADDDGLYNTACLASIVKMYASNPAIDAVTGKIDILWDKAPPTWIQPYEFMLGKLNYGDKTLARKDLFLNGGLFSIKKTVFNQLKGFNPDLVGGYLIGDGDTGLVTKLHQHNSLIGWTPFAIMKHLQFVDRHGTVNDMGRRFYNVGISNSYSLLRRNNFIFNKAMILYILNSGMHYLKKYIELYLSKEKHYKIYFSLQERKGQLSFFRKLLIADIRKEIYRIDSIE